VGVLNRSEEWRPCCCEQASASERGKVLTPLRCPRVRKMINGLLLGAYKGVDDKQNSPVRLIGTTKTETILIAVIAHDALESQMFVYTSKDHKENIRLL